VEQRTTVHSFIDPMLKGDAMRQFLMIMAASMLLMISTLDTTHARDTSGVLKANDLIGMKVEGTDGKTLGDIKDLVIDPMDGDIDYVVLDYGGFFGVSDKYFAVPWDALRFSDDRKKVLLDVTKKDLKQAPGFDKKHWPDLSSQDQTILIYEFYGVPMPDDHGKDPKAAY
jgi:sporulation protein YlmC with PRC-barrel domain